ncbi:MAG: glycoside hydrolase family 32 protein [Clostridia bacterium]|nr:glycoside hydrolase family 32 protein [Clostridia bacterium]
MNSEQLLKARAYELEKEKEIAPDMRPAFHLSARVGWMNDPNGLSLYQGKVHLFYQYNPYRTHWGPMHWAHAVSEDLLHWENLPVAMAPDMPYDNGGGCFSGSAIELPDGRQLLMYTGVRFEKREDGTMGDVQTQCLAIGDGVDYEKVAHNPVLDEKDLPEGASRVDFRDPKIWRGEDGVYRVAIGSRPADGSGQILLFKSEDALHWRYEKVLAENRCRLGRMWECPDFFTLDGKGVLLVSPQDMVGQGLTYHPGNGNIAIIGSWDEATDTFTEEGHQVIDDGVDYYAMQTVLMPDGRRVMIAWMQNWDALEHLPDEKWFGQMSLPREICLKNGRLYQQPIRELESLRVNTVRHTGVAVGERTELPGVCSRCADMEIALSGAYRRFTVNLAEGEGMKTTLTWEPEEQVLILDRRSSGTRRAFVHKRRCVVDTCGQEIRLRVILDRNSVEVFAGEGEKTMSMVLHTPQTAAGISFEADGEAVMDVTLHELAQ